MGLVEPQDSTFLLRIPRTAVPDGPGLAPIDACPGQIGSALGTTVSTRKDSHMTIRSDIDELITQAQTAPPDAREIVGTEGERFRIEWLDVPAGAFRLTERSSRATSWPRIITWFPPRAHRPSNYHRDLPFAASLVTAVVEQGGFLWAQWSLPDLDPAEIVAAALNAMTACPGEERRPQRVQAFREMQSDEVTRRRLDERLGALVESASRSGWRVERDESTESPFAMRKVVLAQNGRRRELIRGGVFGLPTIILH